MTFVSTQLNAWHLEKFFPWGTLLLIIILVLSVLSVAVCAVGSSCFKLSRKVTEKLRVLGFHCRSLRERAFSQPFFLNCPSHRRLRLRLPAWSDASMLGEGLAGPRWACLQILG